MTSNETSFSISTSIVVESDNFSLVDGCNEVDHQLDNAHTGACGAAFQVPDWTRSRPGRGKQSWCASWGSSWWIWASHPHWDLVVLRLPPLQRPVSCYSCSVSLLARKNRSSERRTRETTSFGFLNSFLSRRPSEEISSLSFASVTLCAWSSCWKLSSKSAST